MKSACFCLLSFVLCLFVYGCDSNPYQVVSAPDGSLYRFNKKTGELSMVAEDKKVVKLAEGSKPALIKTEDIGALEKPLDLKESRYPGKNLKAHLETVWRENKLCYKFSVYPYKSLEKAFEKKKQDYIYSLMKPGFNIELVDKNGFLIKEIKINLWNMAKARIKDGEGEELIINSQIDCTRQSYRSLGGYIVKWQLEPDLIEDEKEVYLKSEPIRSEKK